MIKLINLAKLLIKIIILKYNKEFRKINKEVIFPLNTVNDQYYDQAVQAELKHILKKLYPGIRTHGGFSTHNQFDSFVLWWEPTDNIVPIVLKHSENNIYCIHFFDLLSDRLEYFGYIVYDLSKHEANERVISNLSLDDIRLKNIRIKIIFGYIDLLTFKKLSHLEIVLLDTLNIYYSRAIGKQIQAHTSEVLKLIDIKAKFWITDNL